MKLLALAAIALSSCKHDPPPARRACPHVTLPDESGPAHRLSRDPFDELPAPEIVRDLGEQRDDEIAVHHFLFASRTLDVGGQKRQSEISAFIGRPIGGGPHPGLLYLHGGGGHADQGRVIEWARRGYVAMSLDLPGIGNPEAFSDSCIPWGAEHYGERMMLGAPDITHSSIYEALVAAEQAFTLLEREPDVAKDRIGIYGVSWGGFSAIFLAARLGPRARAVLSLYGSGFVDRGSGVVGALAERPQLERDEWLRWLDPGPRIGRITAPTFIAAATNDFFFWMPSVMATLRAIPTSNQVLAPNVSHRLPVPGGTRFYRHKDAIDMATDYFDYWLRGIGDPFPRATALETRRIPRGTLVRYRVESKRPIVSSYVSYSRPAESWAARKWSTIETVKTSDNEWSVVVPLNGDFDWFADATDDRPVTASSPINGSRE